MDGLSIVHHHNSYNNNKMRSNNKCSTSSEGGGDGSNRNDDIDGSAIDIGIGGGGGGGNGEIVDLFNTNINCIDDNNLIMDTKSIEFYDDYDCVIQDDDDLNHEILVDHIVFNNETNNGEEEREKEENGLLTTTTKTTTTKDNHLSHQNLNNDAIITTITTINENMIQTTKMLDTNSLNADRYQDNNDILYTNDESSIINNNNNDTTHDDRDGDNEDNEEEEEEDENNEEESVDHLPRVQIELDKLNYTNESINNLELELEDSKREYVELSNDSEKKLKIMEKKLGSCVNKAKPYYEALIELSELKESYLKAKNLFETAQSLYVAAREMQIYAEDSLEIYSISNQQQINENGGESNNNNNHNENDDKQLATLMDILINAKNKVIEAEISKQKHDYQQIEAYKLFTDKQNYITQYEKSNKRAIEKSKEYFQLKADLNKELQFVFKKIEGLKNCLKEAKFVYQQSLNNLEIISSEIHSQRKLTERTHKSSLTSSSNNCTSSSSSSSTTSDSSSNANTQPIRSDTSTTNISTRNGTRSILSSSNSVVMSDNDTDSITTNTTNSSCRNTNEIINKLSEEQIVNLSLEDQLTKYKQKLQLRPQFRSPLLIKSTR